MRRLFSLKLIWLLCYIFLVLTGIMIICWKSIVSLPARIVISIFSVSALVMISCVIHYFLAIDRMLRASEYIPIEKKHASILACLDYLIDEIDRIKRYKFDSIIADTRAEIDALQSQINPHFLYNTLDSIRGQALIDGSEVTADMIEALSVLFRYSISKDGSLVTIQDELRSIEKYIMIQQFRFNQMLIYEKDIDPSLLSCMIPRLSLQPIVENAIFHGLETQCGRGTIKIHLYRTRNYIVICVSDNGIGIPAEKIIEMNKHLRQSINDIDGSNKKNRHSGIALTNINRRIQLTFGENYGVHIFSAPNVGTDVEILLPLITSADQIGSIGEVKP